MDIKELLAAAIQDAVQKAIDNGVLKSSGVLPEVMLEVPPQKNLAIFLPILQCNLLAVCVALLDKLLPLLLRILNVLL